MLVNVIEGLTIKDSFTIASSNIKHILNCIKAEKGKEYTDEIISNPYSYILSDSKGNLDNIAIIEEVIFSDLSFYDTLYIIPKIEGNEPVSTTMVLSASIAMTGTLAVSAATAAMIAAAINMAIMMAVSFAVNALMSLLSPTPTFSSDPSMAQQKQSNLFNGAPLIREQGGCMPLTFGSPFCGGVLISSSMSSADTI